MESDRREVISVIAEVKSVKIEQRIGNQTRILEIARMQGASVLFSEQIGRFQTRLIYVR